MKRIVALAFVILLTTCVVVAQNAPAAPMGQGTQTAAKKPPLSPPGTAEFTFADGKKVTIDYSRPYAKGREIYGGLVPYDKVWRTGANTATSLKTDVALDINGTKVPAGSYTLYTLPSTGTWKLIVNKQTGQWGTVYKPEEDLARIDMQSSPLPTEVEQFTISFEKKGGDEAQLNLDWVKTRESVTVKEAK